MKRMTLAVTAASLALSACAGREANPVQLIQPGDAQLSCSQLRQEVEINAQEISRLVNDQKKVSDNNAAAVATGAILFFPALFFMNLKGAAKEEASALLSRSEGLATRHNAKGCKPPIVIQKEDPAAAKQEAKKAE